MIFYIDQHLMTTKTERAVDVIQNEARSATLLDYHAIIALRSGSVEVLANKSCIRSLAHFRFSENFVTIGC